ncbi:MAG: hypothetical protein HQL77_07345 [Magnetococcales bacterium]|nr:hypothetical protein [Magnetococcales bacterium]
MLTEFEEDAIKEMFNLSLGNALPTLSEMVDAEIEFSTPCLETTPAKQLTQTITSMVGESACLLHMVFRLMMTNKADLPGNAVLLLRADSLGPFLDALYGEPVPQALQDQVCAEALTDVADLLLYTCISTLSRLLDSELEGNKPLFFRGKPTLWNRSCPMEPNSDVPNAPNENNADAHSITLRIDLSIPIKHVSGSVMIWLDASHDTDLKQAVQHYITTQLC